ncbi:hypothetical protein FC62_GL000453 [Amylolactobacillus amylotrophicus DSM 20534]|uniref:Uncharacterized protein n=3 Tax=Amylolactobacillus TaxID=2767876 RepID=A0A0R1YTU6_9LACO|nr:MULTISPECIES: hypothetical protein [Amylolactobacillus]APT18977.1 hypothetical protein LA20533_06835 [Amylolactobacillus amylophilus DSM 20533 = JCM 1125]KRK38762.1 hypothetical protein FC62_GL000453 [Amylolactobacillus amylotrophicus DSM 20534]KRM42595.1 hypothetical protein FD40_GL000387 [Amylolactobacillus amylophilus DSM 20533 = JCM 1125]GED79982.1 hypothetical protein LAM01_04550 [Amylolactobacillus amylophilus]
MKTRISEIYAVLQQDLGHHLVENYTVGNFCAGIQISRSTFYRSYSSMTELYQFVISYQVERILSNTRETKLDVRYRQLIQLMSSERHLYINFYHQTKRLFFNDVLEPLVQRNLKSFYRETELTEVSLNLIADYVVRQIIRYIDQDLQQPVAEVALDIYRILAVAENTAQLLAPPK